MKIINPSQLVPGMVVRAYYYDRWLFPAKDCFVTMSSSATLDGWIVTIHTLEHGMVNINRSIVFDVLIQ